MSESLCLRQAALADLPGALEVDRQSFGSDGYSWLAIRQLFDISGRFLIVAEQQGKIVGYALGAIQSGATTGWMLSLAVSPATRKMGVGDQLTRELVTRLTASGASTVALTVHPQNDSARKLYQRFGFSESGIEADYFGPGEDRVLMSYRAEQ